MECSLRNRFAKQVSLIARLMSTAVTRFSGTHRCCRGPLILEQQGLFKLEFFWLSTKKRMAIVLLTVVSSILTSTPTSTRKPCNPSTTY